MTMYDEARRAEVLEDVAGMMEAALHSVASGSGECHYVDAHEAEQLAERFHETYERLAPEYGYETRKESAVPWCDVPDSNKRLMVAVCRELLADARYAEPPTVIRPDGHGIYNLGARDYPRCDSLLSGGDSFVRCTGTMEPFGNGAKCSICTAGRMP